MQEYLNLDDAAKALGISKEELSKKAQRREIRAFADRGTWKFRKQDIEEHSRQAGIGSGAEIVFGDLDDELPALDSGSSDQILLSDQTLADAPPGPGGSGARVIGMDEHGRTPSDSDVRLVPETEGKKGSDSDVKLIGGLKPPSDSDVKVVAPPATQTSDSDVKIKGPAPGDSDVRLDRVKAPSDSGIRISSDTALPKGAADVTQDLPVFTGAEDEELGIKTGSSGEQPTAAEFDSDFELNTQTQSESDFDIAPGAGKVKDGSSSDSDITLALDDHIGLAPDEVKLGPRMPSDADVTAGSPSASGVSLAAPADSGIALDEAPAKSGRGLGATEPPKPASDIFETDFEVPVLESDDELAPASSSSSGGDTEQLGGDSDFELSGSDVGAKDADSASQVLSLEDEEPVDESAATSLAPSPAADEEWEEEPEAEGVAADAGAFVQESATIASRSTEDSAVAPAMVPAGAAEAEWGGAWVGVLCFSTFVMVVLGMVMFDMVRTMWGWEEGQYLMYDSPILNWMKGLLPKG